jgi:hypothetical protein
MAQPGSLMLDRGDPRLHEKERDEQDAIDLGAETPSSVGAVRPQHRRLHDPNVTFEEYYYYAQQTRAEEDQNPSHEGERSLLSIIFPSKSATGVKQVTENVEKDATAVNTSDPVQRAAITDEEWTNASRALRSATRGAIFYLITTDILGPFGLPYAFATMGWG